MTASPKVIAMMPGRRDYRVVIQSRDRQPFRITRLQSTRTGVQGRASDPAPAWTQTVEVEGSPKPKDHRGSLMVFTDHPLQQKVDVPIVIVD